MTCEFGYSTSWPRALRPLSPGLVILAASAYCRSTLRKSMPPSNSTAPPLGQRYRYSDISAAGIDFALKRRFMSSADHIVEQRRQRRRLVKAHRVDKPSPHEPFGPFIGGFAGERSRDSVSGAS
jgi:hypothetical protein